jgi:hypothetical protein
VTRGRRRAAIAASFAGAALALWIMRPVEPSRTVDEPTDIAMLDVYETPTDALFDVDGLGFDDEIPAVGCSSGEWGCPELDDEEQSTSEAERRVWS